MATGLTILTRALRMLGDVRQGETPSSAKQAGGLEAFNGLLETLGLDRVMVYQIQIEFFTWPASTVSRTIGAAGDFATQWPVRIETAYVRDSNNVDYPLEITYDRKAWDHYVVKSTETQIPELLFLDRAYPAATIYLRHIPSAQMTIALSSWKRLQVLAAIGDTISLPPGYENMLAYNLAEALWLEYPNPDVLAMITREAQRTRASVKRSNPVPMTMQTEIAYAVAGRGRFDITSDT